MARPRVATEGPARALALLEAGNARFVAGTPQSGALNSRRLELASGQSPFAVVLGCSDSRVPIETIFDQVPGNVFVVRLAGNYLNDDNLGSIEYAVAVLKSQLIVVLGHTHCGAVTAAVEHAKDGIMPPGHIANVVAAIAPAAEETRGLAGDWLENAIVRNVERNVKAIPARSEIVADAVASGDVAIVGGLYDLGTGRVTLA
jgi:carbonic anhydrase